MALTRRVPIRRGQLIRPFGVGSLVVGPDGASMITAGLDHWYEREGGDRHNLDADEFRIDEWRLQADLGVDHFRLPPDLRRAAPGEDTPNTGLRVPMLRFPRWHYCPRCRVLAEFPLTYRETGSCASCDHRGALLQVRFVAMCAAGHLFDFPWAEWIHGGEAPACRGTMRLRATGLAECGCGQRRPLRGVTQGSLRLSPGSPYRCPGRAPWLGSDRPAPCGEDVRVSFRTSSNVYFPHTRSSIYVPRAAEGSPPDLVRILEQPPLSGLIEPFAQAGIMTPGSLRQQYRLILQPFTDEQIERSLAVVRGEAGRDAPAAAPPGGEERETTFRRAEFAVLRRASAHPRLTVRATDPAAYGDALRHRAGAITLVERLRATEALTGFSRVQPDDGRDAAERRRLLWRDPPQPRSPGDWLPAHVVYGEGVFIELDEARLRAWEAQDAVRERAGLLQRRYRREESARPAPDGLSPRFVLLHTLAHLLIGRLTYESGYSSAALRERLYVSGAAEAPVAAILIYTAAGDSDGTLGGLVRLGRPGDLDRIVDEALRRAGWCSADPVCAELATQGGQGPGSCNLAACHACALLPETACEEGNRFLDRALVVPDAGGSGAAPRSCFFGPDTG